MLLPVMVVLIMISIFVLMSFSGRFVHQSDIDIRIAEIRAKSAVDLARFEGALIARKAFSEFRGKFERKEVCIPEFIGSDNSFGLWVAFSGAELIMERIRELSGGDNCVYVCAAMEFRKLLREE